MSNFVKILLVLLAVAILTSCAKKPEDKKVKVICPACGTDFDALFYKKF